MERRSGIVAGMEELVQAYLKEMRGVATLKCELATARKRAAFLEMCLTHAEKRAATALNLVSGAADPGNDPSESQE